MIKRNEIVRANFAKVVEWIKATFPHAIQSSFDRPIECGSLHHVYHTAYLVIKDGNVYFHRGSHGWKSHDTIYDSTNGRYYECNRDVTESRLDVSLEEFMHEWHSQKPYIIGTLLPYEEMYNFEV